MLLTKFHIPAPTKNVVRRADLFEKLNEGLNRKLILISAPAGYGKSTLLSDWITQNKIPVIWYSIDKRDNNIVEFLSAIIQGLQSINKEIGEKSLELLKSPQNINTENIVESILNDILKINTDVFLVLDDFHLIEKTEIFDMISFILEHIPQQFHIIISTRSDPNLPIARLRSQNALIELRSPDLNFSTKDIFTLFSKSLKLNLSNDDVLLLESKTEGWIAGLQLTALSIQGKDNVSDYLKKLAGTNRYIMDYLIEEVLENQTKEVEEFLLKTSVLDKFTASLCDDILKIENSQDLLDSFNKENMFIIPLDNENKWFRYHHLFADLLNQYLIHKYKNELKEIHLRASNWFEQNNLIYEAIMHALKADDISRTMYLLNDNIESHWVGGDHTAILEFGKQLPEQKIIENTKFCIFYTWMLITAGKINIAEKYLNETEKIFINTKKDGDDYKDTLGKLAITYALLYAIQGNMKKVLKYSDQAIKNLSDKNSLWNGWAYIAIGDAQYMNSNLIESEDAYNRAIEYAKKVNNQYLQLTAKYKYALCLARHGRYKSAFQICKEQLVFLKSELNDENIYESYLAGFYNLYGAIQFEWNDWEEGLKNAIKGFELSKKANDISIKIFCYVNMINLYFSLGKLDIATEILEEIEANQEFKQTTPWLSIHVIAWKSELFMYRSEIEKASDILMRYEENLDESINKKPEIILLRLVKLYILQRKVDKALQLLSELKILANEYDKYYLKFYNHVLLAQTYKILNKNSKAKESLIKAIQLAQKENYIRLFIDEGHEIKELLDEIWKDNKTKTSDSLDLISMDYFKKLMAAFELEENRLKSKTDSDLSSRELDTLKLIAENLTNQEIADKLYISITTVKTHVRNILLKLEAKNRIEATNKAKEKGII